MGRITKKDTVERALAHVVLAAYHHERGEVEEMESQINEAAGLLADAIEGREGGERRSEQPTVVMRDPPRDPLPRCCQKPGICASVGRCTMPINCPAADWVAA